MLCAMMKAACAVLMAAVVVSTGCSNLDTAQGQNQGRPAADASQASWHEVALPGKRKTQYASEWIDGRCATRATAKSSASMYRRLVSVPPENAQLRFSWRVDRLIADADLLEVDRSDSPVRVVLAFDGDHSRLSQRNRMLFELAQALSGEAPPYATLMYVWDNRAPVGTVVRSGRSDRIRKIVVESGEPNLGRWLSYERDVARDFRQAFDEEPGRVIGIALMTDADNTRSAAESFYSDVELLAR
jgi:hypothetical protein